MLHFTLSLGFYRRVIRVLWLLIFNLTLVVGVHLLRMRRLLLAMVLVGIARTGWHIISLHRWITPELRWVHHIGGRRIRRLISHILGHVVGHIYLIRRILHLLVRIGGISPARMIPPLLHSIMIPILHGHSIRNLRRKRSRLAGMCWRHSIIRLDMLYFMDRGRWRLLPFIMASLLRLLITLLGRKFTLLFCRKFRGLVIRKVLRVFLRSEFELFGIKLLDLLEHFIREVSVKLIRETTLNSIFDFLKDLLRKQSYPSLSHLLQLLHFANASGLKEN